MINIIICIPVQGKKNQQDFMARTNRIPTHKEYIRSNFLPKGQKKKERTLNTPELKS